MSITSNTESNDFEQWVAEEIGKQGEFTVLVVLAEISAALPTFLCSTYFRFSGAGNDWEEIAAIFSTSGLDWNAAFFFPASDDHGRPLGNAEARLRMIELEEKLNKDSRVLKNSFGFDQAGRRIAAEEFAT